MEHTTCDTMAVIATYREENKRLKEINAALLAACQADLALETHGTFHDCHYEEICFKRAELFLFAQTTRIEAISKATGA